MKAILRQQDAIFYISSSDIIRFISENSDMGWIDTRSFVRKYNIVPEGGADFDKHFWINEVLSPKDHSKEQIKWIGAFFEAHPWINKMMVCYD